MAATMFKTRNGKSVRDGDEVALELAYDTDAVTVTGRVRLFDQVERVYDEDGIAVRKITEKHWEIVTGDPSHPAVGFLPENVISAK